MRYKGYTITKCTEHKFTGRKDMFKVEKDEHFVYWCFSLENAMSYIDKLIALERSGV